MSNKVVRGMQKILKKGLYGTVKEYCGRKEEQRILLDIVQKYHLITEEERKIQKNTKFAYMPCISIITPLYNTPIGFLEQLIKSVQEQTYHNWELCLADGSDKGHVEVEELCRKYAKKDIRIKYKKLEKNDGIVGNTNQAVEMSSGEYCGMLDHDDLLHESALYECVSQIQKKADFIYTDEMRFSEEPSMSTDIICKSGFGKDELRSHNYICHFVVFKKSLLEGMNELYRKECEGSQDYDMVLRLTERAEKVIHIPKILYYWRVHSGSVSMDLSVKQYAVEAAKRAISGQLKREKEEGIVECNLPYETIYRIRYKLSECSEKEKVDNNKLCGSCISICLWGEETDERNIESWKRQIDKIVKKTTYRPLKIIIPVNETREIAEQCLTGISEKNQIRIACCAKKKEEGWYTWIKKAAKKENSAYRICLNYWCEPENPGWVEEMLMYAQRKDVGVVGAKILNRKEEVIFGGGVLDEKEGIHVINHGLPDKEQGYEANMRYVRNTSILTGLCMMISEHVAAGLGDFKETMADFADADLCMESKKSGLWNVWDCFVSIRYTGNKEMQEYWKDGKKWQEKWKDEIRQGDEYYHPLLKELKKV